HPDDTPLAPAPPWLEKLLMEVSRGTTTEEKVLDRIPQGTRNQTLARLAGTMRRPGMSREAIEAALLQENAQRCDPPLLDQEVRSIAASVAQYPPQVGKKLDSRLGVVSDRENRANSASTTFRLSKLKDLLAEPEETRPWLVDGMLPMAGFS